RASGGRKSVTASSSTTTRTPRTEPSPAPTRCGRPPRPGVSAPLTWDEVDTCDPRDFTLATMPARFAALGDWHAAIDRQPGSLVGLLELAQRHEREGLGDAPWPPHYRKQPGEPAPSRRRTSRYPLLEIGRARRKEDALAGLERWKARHPEAAARLHPADVL